MLARLLRKNRTRALVANLLAAGVVLPPLLWLLGSALFAAGNPAARFLDPVARALLTRSLQLALTATGIALLLGVPYGWTAARSRMPAAGFWNSAFLLPLLLPPYGAAFAGSLLLSREGWLNTWLVGAGWIPQPLEPFRSFWLAAWILGAAYWPVIAWFTRAAARSIPLALEEAARLHLTDTRAARWTAAPVVSPAVGAGALLVFLLAFADFGVPNSLGLPTYPVEIVNRFQFDRDPGHAVRLALPLLFLVIPLVWLQVRLLRRASLVAASGGGPPRFGSRAGGWLRAGGCAAVLAATSLLPLAVLAAHSLPLETFGAVWAESSGHFLNTLLSAGGGALLASGVALLHGWGTRGRVPPVLDLALTLPYAFPASLLGVAMIQILNRPGLLGELYTSMGGLIWTYGALFFPFAYKSLQPVWRRLDAELLDESRVLGAGEWVQFRKVAWPAVRPYAAVGTVLVFLLAAREMDATALLRIPGGDTLAFRIHDYLHFAPTPKVAALCLLVVGVSGAALGLGSRIVRHVADRPK